MKTAVCILAVFGVTTASFAELRTAAHGPPQNSTRQKLAEEPPPTFATLSSSKTSSLLKELSDRFGDQKAPAYESARRFSGFFAAGRYWGCGIDTVATAEAGENRFQLEYIFPLALKALKESSPEVHKNYFIDSKPRAETLLQAYKSKGQTERLAQILMQFPLTPQAEQALALLFYQARDVANPLPMLMAALHAIEFYPQAGFSPALQWLMVRTLQNYLEEMGKRGVAETLLGFSPDLLANFKTWEANLPALPTDLAQKLQREPKWLPEAGAVTALAVAPDPSRAFMGRFFSALQAPPRSLTTVPPKLCGAEEPLTLVETADTQLSKTELMPFLNTVIGHADAGNMAKALNHIAKKPNEISWEQAFVDRLKREPSVFRLGNALGFSTSEMFTTVSDLIPIVKLNEAAFSLLDDSFQNGYANQQKKDRLEAAMEHALSGNADRNAAPEVPYRLQSELRRFSVDGTSERWIRHRLEETTDPVELARLVRVALYAGNVPSLRSQIPKLFERLPESEHWLVHALALSAGDSDPSHLMALLKQPAPEVEQDLIADVIDSFCIPKARRSLLPALSSEQFQTRIAGLTASWALL